MTGTVTSGIGRHTLETRTERMGFFCIYFDSICDDFDFQKEHSLLGYRTVHGRFYEAPSERFFFIQINIHMVWLTRLSELFISSIN